MPWEPDGALQAGGVLGVTKSTPYVQTPGEREVALEGTRVNGYFTLVILYLCSCVVRKLYAY